MTSAGNRKPKIATVIGSDKGGIGKSLIASLLADAYEQARRPLSVIEIDHQGKLRTSMGKRVNLSLGASADLGEIAKDRKYAERFYNPVFNCWRDGDTLTDLGANVTTQLFNWMQQCHIGELAAIDDIRFRFVAVTTPDDQALRSAYSALCSAVRQLGEGSEFYLVLNAFSSNRGFDLLEHHPVFKDLANLRQQIALNLLFIPNCDSDLMEYGRARALSPLAVYQERERLIEEMGLGRVEAHTEQKRFVSWMMEVQESLRPLFVDQQPSTAKADLPSSRSEPAKVHDFPHGEAAERREEMPRRTYSSTNGAVVEDLLGRREIEGFDSRPARRVHAVDRAS
jgi:hypothetical protein